MRHLIYVTEDEENIRELLRCTLESFGHEVCAFETAEELLEALQTKQPSLVLLDRMLPGMDGMDALKEIKTNPSTARLQVILLTARSTELDKVRGLDCGADDYITKPFGVLELSARIRAALRRIEEQPEKELLCGEHITLNPSTHETTVDGAPVELTYKEFELLRLLMESGRVIPREELLNRIWGYDFTGETRTLDVHVKTLRAKLGDNADSPRFVRTVRGVGYRFIG